MARAAAYLFALLVGLAACRGTAPAPPPGPAPAETPLAPARSVTLTADVTVFSAGAPPVVAVGLADGHVGVWNGRDPAAVLHRAHEKRVIAVRATAGGGDILSLAADGALRRTSLESGATVLQSRVAPGAMPARAAIFSADGTQVIVGGELGDIAVFDSASGALRRRLEGHRGELYTLALGNGSATLASTAADADLRIWDLATGRALQVVDNDVSLIGADFNPRDGSLVSGGVDRRVTLRHANTWQADPLLALGAPDIVVALAWSPDGRSIAVGSVDDPSLGKGRIDVVDRERRAVTVRLDTGGAPTFSLGFANDRTVVAVVGRDLRAWDTPAP